MNIYIDESGSINNHSKNTPYFIIALVHVIDPVGLRKAYKRFVASNYERLQELDNGVIDIKTGVVRKPSGKMFINGKFAELKGAQFDKAMKQKFLEFFLKKHYFDLYIIKIKNDRLTDEFTSNTARVFNYTLRLALSYFINKGYLTKNEECFLQLDERNEKTETKYFLENYLNTELVLGGTTDKPFRVQYFDSVNNKFIQIADVFANLYYSNLITNGGYEQEIERLKEENILKFVFEYPM